MSQRQRVFFLKIIIHLSALLPLINVYYLAIIDQLGADPVEAIIHFTGISAFNLLLITLAVSPLIKLSKHSYLMQTRRLLGLYAFLYGVCHVVNFLAFEVQFSGELFISEVIERPYITIGMIAFLFLIALAITSINTLKRKMGKSWQQLHNFNYLIVILVAIHFYWSVKSELTSPLFYAVITLILLLFRYKKIKRLISTRFA